MVKMYVRGQFGHAREEQVDCGLCQELFLADGVQSGEEDEVLKNLRELLE